MADQYMKDESDPLLTNIQNTNTRSTDTDQPSVTVEMTPRPPTSALRVFGVAVTSVLMNVMMNVSLPIFAGTMEVVGGDTYVVLLYGAMTFPVVLAAMTLALKVTVDRSLSLKPTSAWRTFFLLGLCNTLNGVGVVFASPPDRTAPYLQGILATIQIPFTVFCRFLILRKGISVRRLFCTIAVLIGIFITIEPQIWSLPGSGSDSSSGGSAAAHVIWPMIFAVAFLPFAIFSVICERELKKGESQSLSFMTWTQVLQFLTILPLFWVDFIPFYGMAKNFKDFGHRMHRGFECNFSSAPDCRNLAFKGWIFILGYTLGGLFQFLLIKYAEGAVFAVVVQSLVTPLATLFWTFFKFDVPTDHFYWDPQFTETTAFTIGGLLIIVPAVILYNVFSKQEAAQPTESNKQEMS
ncbi:hypothetical protein BaRGS_00017833 [Batillaria attramentaria]|uniref:Uncharacterized protein n=1 Tax=Batillaria attramentaria TaxID=370345 RepID=A0ABD0KUL3_9CAEN